MWAIHLEKDKMSRLTQGRFDAEVLQERSKHKAIIRDVPKSAIETAFLRQIKGTKAKAIYISKNRNGNQWQIASIYFANEEDKQIACKHPVYYYNTKLDWVVKNKEKQ